MKCSSCTTSNPVSAKFCFECGKAFEKTEDVKYTLEIPSEIKAIRSWGKILVNKLPMPYWVSLILLWQLLLCVDFFLSHKYGADPLLLFNFFFYGAFAGTSIVIEFCNQEMQKFYPRIMTFVSEPSDKIKEWYRKSLRFGYMSKGSLLFGIILSTAASISVFDIVDAKSEHISILTWYRTFTSFIGLFFLGTGIWAMFSVIKITNQLSNFRINVKLLAVGNESVMALGSLFLKMSLAIAGVYILVVISNILAGALTSYVVLFWHGFSVISILLFFIVPQYRIHKIMINEKNQRIQSFSVYLEKTMNESLNNPSAENLQHLKELFELKEHLSGMHEWTFSSAAISQLISVLVIPLLLVLLEVYMSK